MTMPLQINDSLFFRDRHGVVQGTWGLALGDNSSDEMRQDYIAWCERYKCDGVILQLCNEGYVSVFQPGDNFMGAIDWAKFNNLIAYSAQLKALGGKIVYCFFDEPGEPGNLKYPFHKHRNRWEDFYRAACQTLNPYASAYLFSCESNEWLSAPEVAAEIAMIKRHAGLIPVGSHEQWRPDSRPFCGGDFCCYETLNHPKDGDSVSVDTMQAEVRNIQAHLPPGFPVWVSEFNMNPDGARSKAQARGFACMPGVVGVGGPLG